MTRAAVYIDAAHSDSAEHHDVYGVRAFGFWIYLMTDVILFATLFATFAVLSRSYAGGPNGKDLFDLSHTLGETMLLLFSSGTYGMATLAAHNEKKHWVLAMLAATFVLGAGFISMEIHEFHSLIVAGDGPQRSAFLSAFCTLVGTHGTHVTLGLIWMAVMMGQVVTKGLTPPVRSRLLRLAMFWHFLDVVWVGVFTVVYLMGAM